MIHILHTSPDVSNPPTFFLTAISRGCPFLSYHYQGGCDRLLSVAKYKPNLAESAKLYAALSKEEVYIGFLSSTEKSASFRSKHWKKNSSFTNIAFIVVLGLKQLAFPPFLYFWVPWEFQKASLDTIRITVVWGSFLNRKEGAEISFREIGNHHWAVKAYYSLQCRNKMSLLCLTGGMEGVWEGGRFCETVTCESEQITGSGGEGTYFSGTVLLSTSAWTLWLRVDVCDSL